MEKKGTSVRETPLFKFGGELHTAKSFMPLLLTGLAAPEYSLRDAYNIRAKGVSLYSGRFVYNSISGELMDVITRVKTPVYFFTGRYDYCDPYALTEQYFSKINAPDKHMIWFENSGPFSFLRGTGSFRGRCGACGTQLFPRCDSPRMVRTRRDGVVRAASILATSTVRELHGA
jgi:pimeloyl-ACP methyl ester carboxylesterase